MISLHNKKQFKKYLLSYVWLNRIRILFVAYLEIDERIEFEKAWHKRFMQRSRTHNHSLQRLQRIQSLIPIHA